MGPPGTAGAAGTGADGAAGCCIAAGSRAGQECFDVQQPLGLLLFSLSEVPREHFFTALGDVHSLRPEGGRGYGEHGAGMGLCQQHRVSHSWGNPTAIGEAGAGGRLPGSLALTVRLGLVHLHALALLPCSEV